MGVVERLAVLSVGDREWLRRWCMSLDLQPTTGSTYVAGRGERWFRHASDLRARVFRVVEPPDDVARLGDSYLGGWTSLLVCGHPTSIQRHTDHKHFLRQAVMINVDGTADFTTWVRGGPPVIHSLEPGGVYALDVGVPHASRQTSSERHHLTFRRVWPHLLSEVR